MDQSGLGLDTIEQSRRDKRAAKRLMCKLLKEQMRLPRVMITDKLPSYSAAKAEVIPSVEHRRHKGLHGDIDVTVRVQLQRSSSLVRWEDSYELIRGELAIGRGSSRRELVSGGPRGAQTMMRPYASAAKLRGGGSNLNSGSWANPLFGTSPPRIMEGSSPRRRR